MVELPERERDAPGPQGEGDLAAPVDLRAVADLDHALADGVEHLEGRDERAGRIGLDLDAPVGHFGDALDVARHQLVPLDRAGAEEGLHAEAELGLLGLRLRGQARDGGQRRAGEARLDDIAPADLHAADGMEDAVVGISRAHGHFPWMHRLNGGGELRASHAPRSASPAVLAGFVPSRVSLRPSGPPLYGTV